MAEQVASDSATAEALSVPPFDTEKTPEDLKENPVTVLSAAVDGVFHEADNETPPAEHLTTLCPEIQPSSIDSTHNPPPSLADSKTNEAPPADTEMPPDETAPEGTEKTHSPASLPPIPEVSPPPTAPHPGSQEASLLPEVITSTSVPSQREQIEVVASAISETVGEPADRVGPETTPVVASPPEVSSEAEELSSVPDDAHPQTSPSPTSEQLSTTTVVNLGTPGGSTNDLFLSTKSSTENASEPPPTLSKQASSAAVSIVLQKINNLNLSEEAMKVAKAVSEELLEKQQELHNVGASLEEKRTTVKKSALNLEDVASVLSPKEIVEGIVGDSSEKTFGQSSEKTFGQSSEKTFDQSPEKTQVETLVTTEVPPIRIETSMDEIDVESTGAEVQKETDVSKSDTPKVLHETLHPETEIALPVQAEVEVPKQAEDFTRKDAEAVQKESVLDDPKNPTVPEDTPTAQDKPMSELPIRQRDNSKDPPKKQVSKTVEKAAKVPAKTSRVPSQPGNSGQTGVIAATGSASATSALSPRSEKGVKQIKSPRPVSARSARGLGDLSSSNSVLGILSTQLTGPQRVAAARAAAAAAGIKTRKISAAVPVDGNRSPRDKPSATSTVSNIPAATSPSATSSIAASINSPAAQKRAPGSSSTVTHPAAPRRGATGTSLTDGHRAVGNLQANQKLKSSNDLSSLESTYSALLKTFIDAKKELQLKTKLAHEMFAEIEKLRHLACTKFGKDLPLNEDTSGLAEATALRAACIVSEDGNRTIDATESLLKALLAQRADLLNETSHHHANLLALCCEAAGDEGAMKTPALLCEKEFADLAVRRVTEIAATERSYLDQVLQVLRTSLSDLEGSKASCRDLRSQLELLNQENSTLTKSLTDCTKELEESRAELGKTAARKVAIEKEAKALRMRLKETEAKIVAEEQKSKDLAAQVRSLEDKVRSKDLTQEQRMKETERRVRERVAKEHEELQRRLDEALKSKQIKESKLEATCLQLDSKLGSVTQLLELKTKDKERIEEKLKATTEKLSRITVQRSAETEELRRERAALVERLHNMAADEVTANRPQLKSELQALSDLLDERERIIEEKDAEIKRLKDSSKEGGDSQVSKEEFLELQDTLSRLGAHNEMLEQELSKMVQSAAKRERAMEEQEKVLVIRNQLIALLQDSKDSSTTGSANPRDVAVQQKMLDLQTTVERQAVRIKALEAQLAETEKHQDGLQSLRTRYERRIAQLEHALSDQRGTQRSETLSKLRTLLHGNLGQ